MRGRLKQKHQGPDGIFFWEWKNLQLDAARSLLVTGSSDGYGNPRDDYCCAARPDTQVSLEGARYAVALSGDRCGFGFDLVWASGRTWSFLCEDSFSTNSWVDALNLCIRSAETRTGGVDVDIASGACPKAPTSPGSLEGSNRQPRRPPRRSSPNRHGGESKRLDDDSCLGEAPPSAWTAVRARSDAGHQSLSFCPSPTGAGEGTAQPSRAGTRDCHFKHDAGRFGGGGNDQVPPEQAVTSRACLRLSRGARGEQSQRRRRQREGGGTSRGGWKQPTHQEFVGGAESSSDGDWHPQQQHQHQQHQHQHEHPQRGQGRRRQRGGNAATEGTALASGGQHDRPSSRSSETGRSALLSPRVHGAVDGAACSNTDSSAGAGGGGARKSGTSQRSEELARASAATWEQFQQLLERSRRSKDRFDKAMDGAAAAAAAGVSSSGRAPAAGLSSADARGAGRHPFPKAEPAAAAAFRDGRMAVSTGGSSTDSASDLPTPTYRAEVVVGGDISRTTIKSGLDSPPNPEPNALAASFNSGGDAAGELERSRLSARVTDVETSLLLKLEEGGSTTQSSSSSSSSGGGGGGGSGGSVGSFVDRPCGNAMDEGAGRRRKQRQKGQRRYSRLSSPSLSSKPSASLPPRQRRKSTETEEREIDGIAAAAAASADRVQQLEVDLEAARREAEAAAQTESILRRQLAELTRGASGGGGVEDDWESSRLREELAAAKAALAGQRERERKAADARAVREREEERERAAAAAVMQGRLEERIEEALAEAAKAEGARAEAVRQKQELEKALAAEIGERQRVSALLDACSRSERALRERVDATASEGDLKARLASAQSELEAVSLERNALAKELDQCISRLGDQAREVTSALRSRQQREIEDISSRCEVEKEALRERLLLEAEEKARETTKSALEAQERRIRGEAAAKAAKDSKRRDRQLREARAEAEAAGEATRKDIEKLRALHAKRVKRLEALLKEEGDNLADARREIAVCKATLAGDAGEFQRWTDEQRDQSNRVLKELAAIQRKVDRAVTAEAQAREREAMAMGRLKKVMEEARLERAEGAEVKRQLREALAELESDRNAQALSARNNLQLRRATEIAQQEVAMVEAERVRWHEERRSMEAALERLTRLVYGASNCSSSGGRTTTNSGRALTTATGAGAGATSRKHTPGCPWKPPGGVRVVTAGGRRGHPTGSGRGSVEAREACSPIGVNVL